MLKLNRKIAIVMAFVFCLSFMAPAFIAPSVAEAAFTATVAQSNNVPSTNLDAIPAIPNQNLGYVKVEVNVADWSAATGSQLLISIPTRLAKEAPSVGMGATVAATTGDIKVVVPEDTDNALNPSGTPALKFAGATLATSKAPGGSVFLEIDTTTSSKEKGWFYVHLTNIDTRNYAGDVNVNLIPQTGTAFGTTPSALVVGKVNVTGSTTTTVKSVEKITSGGGGLGQGQIDTITIFENMRDTIIPSTNPANANITLTLVTKGYEWAAPGLANGLFNFAGRIVNKDVTVNGDTATLPVTETETPSNAAGAISISGLRIKVDEKVAKVGQDIEVKVSGAGVTEQTIVVAQYVDFVANVIEDTTTELTAGLSGQKIGTFFIEEVAPGTLVGGRTILFELPAGVEWNTAAIANSNYEMVNNSAITFNASGATPLDSRTLKFTVGNTSQFAQNGAKVKFKGLKVDVSPSFKGDVTLTVKGKAGVEGTAKVATVSPMITMTASVPEVNLGIKEQKVSDVEIVETKADTIAARIAGVDQSMVFYLDSGFRFAKVPKVEVIEGDMVLELNDVKIQAPSNQQNLLLIPMRAASYKTPAKIKISDIYVTADRNAPVGDVVLYAADTSTYSNPNGSLQNAFNTSVAVPAAVAPVVGRTSFQYDTPASVAIAKNVTAPPVETKGGTGSGTFVIGSNIYTVNGLTKVMDVAPYIKNDRTYVPYRYLALALGVAEEDIVWDAAAQKVTVTKGENTVEAVIGSTTLTVNGSAVTMDVAPEISNSRTMLPARFLAEALGATVGWDPATQTVVFEM